MRCTVHCNDKKGGKSTAASRTWKTTTRPSLLWTHVRSARTHWPGCQYQHPSDQRHSNVVLNCAWHRVKAIPYHTVIASTTVAPASTACWIEHVLLGRSKRRRKGYCKKKNTTLGWFFRILFPSRAWSVGDRYPIYAVLETQRLKYTTPFSESEGFFNQLGVVSGRQRPKRWSNISKIESRRKLSKPSSSSASQAAPASRSFAPRSRKHAPPWGQKREKQQTDW